MKKQVISGLLALSIALSGSGLTAELFAPTAVSAESTDSVEDVSQIKTYQTYGAAASTGSNVTDISSFINYSSYSDQYKQIPCEERGGMYFFLEDAVSGETGSLYFYSFEDKQATDVWDLSSRYITDSFVQNDTLYVLATDYVTTSKPYHRETKLYAYDLVNQTVSEIFSVALADDNFLYYAESFGVDESGRIYIASEVDDSYYIRLYSPDMELLSQTETNDGVYEFFGFDSTNGNFYFRTYYNYVYWGYDHAMNALAVGNVSGDDISVNNTTIDLISQQYFFERQTQVELIENKYLCEDSIAYSRLAVVDSNTLSAADFSCNTLLSVSRNNEEGGDFDKLAAVGTRAVYREAGNSIVAYKDLSTIAEYSLDTGELVREISTAHPVFSLSKYGDKIAAVEKDGTNFYLEIFDWKVPTAVTISAPSATMKVGASMQLTASTDADFNETYTWSSSDSKTVSVTQTGSIYAWRKGTAVITVKTASGLSTSFTVTVNADSTVVTPTENKTNASGGTASNNASDNTYDTYGNVVNSYLTQNSDGTLQRVEYIDGKLIAETYSSDGKTLKNTVTIKCELSLFGGFYSGSDYNYLVFGQKNSNESDSTEVVRVVKYTKSWTRVSSTSIKGANTYIPFDAGSLRMTETNGKLYVYTCHEMYQTEDGYHHQSNMTYVIKESDMSVVDSYYDIMNIGYGYVSHSFNEFIQTDGEYVYRADHGDAYPRGASITKCSVSGDITDVDYTIPIYFSGGSTGYNYTGASIGGFELSSENCIIAGNSEVQKDNYTYGCRNVFLTVTDKNLNSSKTIWLTNYASTESREVGTPQLVKIGTDQFLVMWEEYIEATDKTVVKLVTVDGSGNLTSDVVTATSFRLSDCQPIMCSDGLVRWYVTTGGKPTFYTINPVNMNIVHTHKYVGTVTKAATCTTSGVKTYTCECGESYTETIKATGHKYTETVVAPTYAAKGYTLHKCSVCGNSYKDKYTDQKVPETVKTAGFSSTTNTVTIKWNKVADATGYRIYRYNTSTKKWSTVATIKNNTTQSYTIPKLTVGTVYKFKVKAYVKYDGTNYWGSSSETLATATKPSAVKISKAKAAKTAVRLYWNKVSGADGYRLQKYDTAKKKWVTVKAEIASGETNYKITGLSKNKSYKFRIQAYKKVGTTKVYGAWSAIKTVKTTK